MATSYGWWSSEPGSTAALFNTESNIFWGSGSAISPANLFITLNISSAATDATNSPTTILRPGLIMGKITSSGLWTAYSPTATDGSQQALAILPTEINMLDPVTAAVANRVGVGVISGPIKASALVNLDNMARKQLEASGVIFDDTRGSGFGVPYVREVAKAASYTVLATDNGTQFNATTGAVTFTLPTLAAGLHFMFYNEVDANMTITSAAGNDIFAIGDAAASSVAFSTASQKIGSCAMVVANAAGTAWRLYNLGGTTATPT